MFNLPPPHQNADTVTHLRAINRELNQILIATNKPDHVATKAMTCVTLVNNLLTSLTEEQTNAPRP